MNKFFDFEQTDPVNQPVLFIICMASTPARIHGAVPKDLNPNIERTRF